jgi:hypothetical protein
VHVYGCVSYACVCLKGGMGRVCLISTLCGLSPLAASRSIENQ